MLSGAQALIDAGTGRVSVPERVRTYFGKWIPISIIVGVFAGLLGMAFMVAVDDLWEFGTGYSEELPFYLVIAMPAIGGFLVGIMLHLRPIIGRSGTDNVLRSYHCNNGRMRILEVPLSALASIITMGFGGSAGIEAPIAEIGGGSSSLVSRVLRLSPGETRTLLVVGMAAGFSAALKAPLGGAIFALELPYRDSVDSSAFIPSIVASVVSYLVVVGVTGSWTPILDIGDIGPIVNLDFLPYIIVTGIIVGLVGWAFIKSMDRMGEAFRAWDRPIYYRTAIAGLAVGVIGLIVPGALGLGEQTMERMLTGEMTGIYILLALLLGKLVATSLTLGSGQLGGILFPSMIMGGAVGGLVAEVTGFPDPLLLILAGMGSMIACVPKTPVAAPIVATEMAGSFNFLIPMLIASVISYIISGRSTIFSEQRDRLNIPAQTEMLGDARVGDIMNTEVVTIPADVSIKEAFSMMVQRPHTTYPVLDGEDLVGMVDRADIISRVQAEGDRGVMTLTKTFFSTMDEMEPVTKAAFIMRDERMPRIAVTTSEGSLVGMLTLTDLMSAVEFSAVTDHGSSCKDLPDRWDRDGPS